MCNSLRPHGLYRPWDSPGQNTGVGSLFLLQGIFTMQEWTEPRFPALQAYSLPAEPQGKPRNTGVGSLSLLQQIFLTHSGIKLGLLHCRWILYQLSCQRSPQGDLFPPSIKPRIFYVLGKRGNHYTMETTHILERLNIREVKNYIRA